MSLSPNSAGVYKQMPRRAVHQSVGAVASIAVAAYAARDQQPDHQAVEIIAAGFSGWHASRLPDIIDPPTSGNHRGVGHSLAQGAVGIRVAQQKIPEIQQRLRARAEEFAARHRRAELGFNDPLPTWQLAAAELFFRIQAGALVGLAVGIGSHLLLDAGTPRSLPLFV